MNNCKTCGKLLTGRADKKFCDVYCKNSFHRHKDKKQMEITQKVDRYLHRNRRILQNIVQKEGKNKVFISRQRLVKEGFLFDYCTGLFINKEGKLYRYIYDFAWMEFQNNKIMIIQNESTH